MDIQRPLRAVFDDLAGSQDRDVAELLRDAGHGDLPEGLLADALTSYADTASVEVAEQLAPFVTAHTGGFADDVAQGLELLSGAAVRDLDADDLAVEATETAEAPVDRESLDFDFGIGSESDELDLGDLAFDDRQEDVEMPLDTALDGRQEDVEMPGGLPEEFGEGAGVADAPEFNDPTDG